MSLQLSQLPAVLFCSPAAALKRKLVAHKSNECTHAHFIAGKLLLLRQCASAICKVSIDSIQVLLEYTANEDASVVGCSVVLAEKNVEKESLLAPV